MENYSIESVGKDWGWVMAGGLALMLVGIVTLNWPVSSTLSLTFALAVMLLAAGAIHAINAVQMRKKSGWGWRIIQTLAALAAGVLMLRYPAVGMEGIAIALTFYFFVTAVAKGLLAASMRPVRGWGWIFASAIASAVLGTYILFTLPFAAVWIPGFVFGLDLLMYGAGLVAISLDLKHIHRSVAHISNANLTAHSR